MEPPKDSYYDVIYEMMIGFGDSHMPNPDTVRLVESITLAQLRLIVQEATKYQEGKKLNAECLVFLMRKNKYKMRRFIKYLQVQDMKRKVDVNKREITKNILLLDFIESIDETGELTDLSEYDEVKYERLVRADRISLALDEENYMKYFKARCATFRRRKAQHCNTDKLQAWVDPKQDVKFSIIAIDILSYYAYETVAQIIDLALLVRLDHNRTSDPLSNLKGMHFSAAMFNREPEPDYNDIYNKQAAISVNEIKEVMRRIYMPQVGKLNFGKKLPEWHQILAI